MNSDLVKTKKDVVDDGKKKRKALLMKSEDWRESCWSVDDGKKKDWEKTIRVNVICGVYCVVVVANADVEDWKPVYVFFCWNCKNGSKLVISPDFTDFTRF